MEASKLSAEKIQEVTREVISRSKYQLGVEGKPPEEIPWFLRLIIDFFRWLVRTFEVLFNVSPLIAWVLVAVMVLILVAILVQMGFFIRSMLKREEKVAFNPTAGQAAADPARWERQADEAARQGDFLLGVRSLFLALITRLELMQGKAFRRGMTNRELSRRYSQTSLQSPIQQIVNTLERTWFGFDPCAEGDYRQVKEAYQGLKEQIQRHPAGSNHAHRA